MSPRWRRAAVINEQHLDLQAAGGEALEKAIEAFGEFCENLGLIEQRDHEGKIDAGRGIHAIKVPAPGVLRNERRLPV